ncbi:Transcription factor [Aspergillus sp. HF37]|nr:Transcription factor [Aspergillus sp. HF37]
MYPGNKRAPRKLSRPSISAIRARLQQLEEEVGKSYQQQHVVALILSELCDRRISPETNHAWDLVKGIYDEWQRGKHETNIQLQEPLSLLMERADISRQKKLMLG